METAHEYVRSLPHTLFKADSKGRVQIWTIMVQEVPEGGKITTTYGFEGGKMQVSEEIITEGKNLGRANATTALQQAITEANARWTKQIERKGYKQDREALTVETRPGIDPMLAHRYDKHPEKIQFPCAVQPKLDGHRCIAIFENGQTKLFSRQRKPITGLPHVEQAITNLMVKINRTDRLVFDGELYNHDYKKNFEELTSHIRSSTPKEGYTIVQYHVYDLVVGIPFLERNAALEAIMSCYDGDVLKKVDTRAVETAEDVVKTYADHMQSGYEGSMLRNFESPYIPRRSYDLLKVKQFRDEEFMVTGVEEGRGKMAGKAIFVCATEDGKEFRCKMSGNMERLADFFKNPEKCLKRLITVQFQDYTSDGVPRFPVALRFREDV